MGNPTKYPILEGYDDNAFRRRDRGSYEDT